MDIRINGNRPVQNAGLESGLPSGGMKPIANQEKSALTVTQADAVEDVNEVPDDALDRNDALGKLISSVYNLPAPPMVKD